MWVVHLFYPIVISFFIVVSMQFCIECAKPVYYSIEQQNDAKTIAITFDDGPHKVLTPRLLDILKLKNVKVTFFVMGIKVAMHPSIVARAMKEGHEIANHVWNHPVLSKITFAQVHEQLDKTNSAIFNATGKSPSIMRPPYGNTNKKLNDYIYKKENLTVIMWSLDTLDWKRPTPKSIVEKVIKLIKPGAVLLCHDIHPGTIEAMPDLIDQLIGLKYNFSTISSMISHQK